MKLCPESDQHVLILDIDLFVPDTISLATWLSRRPQTRHIVYSRQQRFETRSKKRLDDEDGLVVGRRDPQVYCRHDTVLSRKNLKGCNLSS